MWAHEVYLLTNNERLGMMVVQERYSDARIPEAYERLILDAVHGDQQHFVRRSVPQEACSQCCARAKRTPRHECAVNRDELTAAWKIFTPLLHAVDRGELKPLQYPAGTNLSAVAFRPMLSVDCCCSFLLLQAAVDPPMLTSWLQSMDMYAMTVTSGDSQWKAVMHNELDWPGGPIDFDLGVCRLPQSLAELTRRTQKAQIENTWSKHHVPLP